MLSRLGPEAGRAFLRSMESSRIAAVRPSPRNERGAREIVFSYADKSFSLTDAISFAVMRRLRIRVAFSFDDDFRQFGFAMAQAG